MGVQALSNLIAVVVSLGVGGHLLWKAWRDRALPEGMLGACLAFDGLEWLLWALYLYTPLAGSPHGYGLAVACRVGIASSACCMLLFTRAVFRPRDPHAATAAYLGIALMGAAIVTSGASGDWGGFSTETPWVWLELGCQAGAYGWTLVESHGYYRKMRRRVLLGLADGVVANRFALWALYAGLRVASHAVYGVSLELDDARGQYPLGLDLLMVSFTSVAQIAVWLAFFPPRRYLDWVRTTARPA